MKGGQGWREAGQYFREHQWEMVADYTEEKEANGERGGREESGNF